MRYIFDFSDERQKAWCLHCTRTLAGLKTSKDHVPTKGLLRLPHPSNLPIVRICAECNNGFSKDEQYFVAFLSAAISGTTDPANQIHPGAARIFRNQDSLRARIDRAAHRFKTLRGEEQILWRPETERIEKVVLKNARGHAFYEFGEPMLQKPQYVWAKPLQTLTPGQRDEFESVPSTDGFPEVGSRMMSRVITGADLDGSWVSVQKGVYRYAVEQFGTMMVRSVIFDYLATEVVWD